ncbi:MAG: hypothetical protein CL609_15225 [Anaerolineaceae bacterium]|nr:hypothetical protein [Anaerolineaceae bacterium]
MSKTLFNKKPIWLTTLILLFLISACQLSTPTPTPTTTIPTLPPTVEIIPTNTVEVTDTPTTAPTATTEPSPTITNTPEPTIPSYLDDRSTATGLMDSFFNAINRAEYLRAYNYWRDPAAQLGNFNDFAAGYDTTSNVEVTYGQIGGDAGAGQMYYSVPLILTVTNTDSSIQYYSACYILRLSQPAVQATPPFKPLGIERAIAVTLSSDADLPNVLETACTAYDFPVGAPLPTNPVTNHEVYTADNYLDERSEPILVIRSFYNALNRHEFLRAYSYWKNPVETIGSYSDFLLSHQNIDSVEFVSGETTVDAGAGQRYYQVPVAVRLTQTGGSIQTLQGCYTLHLSLPGIQATPPFEPIGIRERNLTAADNTTSLMDILNTVSCGF